MSPLIAFIINKHVIRVDVTQYPHNSGSSGIVQGDIAVCYVFQYLLNLFTVWIGIFGSNKVRIAGGIMVSL